MRIFHFIPLVPALLVCFIPSSSAQNRDTAPAKFPTTVTNAIAMLSRPKAASIGEEEITGFSEYSSAVQKLLRAALTLSRQKLGYRMGSADPAEGGMDCSGTVYYLLKENGMTDVPRSSYDQYVWTRDAGTLHSSQGLENDLKAIQPGDLLFWAGTYGTHGRSPAISHVMLYLGTRKSDGKPLMIGGDDGRHYAGKARWGVGVFDFTEPNAKSKAKFVGYAKVPGFDSKK